MTAKELEKYQHIKQIIEDIEEEISELKGQRNVDVVKTSHKEFPYTQHTIAIHSYSYDELTNNKKQELIRIKQQRQAELEEQRIKIEQFIDNIEDEQIRKIIKLKYIQGYSWSMVARAIGGNNTRDSVRIMCSRFLKKY